MYERITEPAQIKAMDPEQLLNQYKRFIIKIGNKFQKIAEKQAWLDMADVYQVAAIALLKAQESHDPEKGSFMNYAASLMVHDIMNALKIRWTPDGYQHEQAMISLDEPINEDGDITRGDTIPSKETPIDEQIEQKEVVSRVRAAVDALPDEEEEIIDRLFLQTPTESRNHIADEKGVSRACICRMQEKAFVKLRRQLRDLKEFVPRHIGLAQFRTNWISEPELYVLTYEKRLEQFEKQYEKNL